MTILVFSDETEVPFQHIAVSWWFAVIRPLLPPATAINHEKPAGARSYSCPSVSRPRLRAVGTAVAIARNGACVASNIRLCLGCVRSGDGVVQAGCARGFSPSFNTEM